MNKCNVDGLQRRRGKGEKIELSSDNMWKETKLSLIEVYDSFVLLSSIGFTCKGYIIKQQ